MVRFRTAAGCALTVLIGLSIFLSVQLVRPPSARAALPDSVSAPINRANEALARTESRIANHQYKKALHSLMILRRNVVAGNNAAIDQIGRPPSDPESDEPPGPACVFAALKLDHQVGMRLVPLFDGLTSRDDVVERLLATLVRTHDRRDAMLDDVIALSGGKRGDYDDGMADTLTMYPAEEKALTTGLNQYELTDAAKAGFQDALERVKATEAKVRKIWGGGE